MNAVEAQAFNPRRWVPTDGPKATPAAKNNWDLDVTTEFVPNTPWDGSAKEVFSRALNSSDRVREHGPRRNILLRVQRLEKRMWDSILVDLLPAMIVKSSYANNGPAHGPGRIGPTREFSPSS